MFKINIFKKHECESAIDRDQQEALSEVLLHMPKLYFEGDTTLDEVLYELLIIYHSDHNFGRLQKSIIHHCIMNIKDKIALEVVVEFLREAHLRAKARGDMRVDFLNWLSKMIDNINLESHKYRIKSRLNTPETRDAKSAKQNLANAINDSEKNAESSMKKYIIKFANCISIVVGIASGVFASAALLNANEYPSIYILVLAVGIGVLMAGNVAYYLLHYIRVFSTGIRFKRKYMYLIRFNQIMLAIMCLNILIWSAI